MRAVELCPQVAGRRPPHDRDTRRASQPVMFHLAHSNSNRIMQDHSIPRIGNIDSLCEHLRETFTGSIDRWTLGGTLLPPPSLLLPPSCRFVAGIRNKFEGEFKVRVNSFIRKGA